MSPTGAKLHALHRESLSIGFSQIPQRESKKKQRIEVKSMNAAKEVNWETLERRILRDQIK